MAKVQMVVVEQVYLTVVQVVIVLVVTEVLEEIQEPVQVEELYVMLLLLLEEMAVHMVEVVEAVGHQLTPDQVHLEHFVLYGQVQLDSIHQPTPAHHNKYTIQITEVINNE
jgi:hypothetical protein